MDNDFLIKMGIIPGDGSEPDTDRPEDRPVRPDFELTEKESNVPEIEDSDAKADYQFARSAVYALINMNLKITHRAAIVAEETEHPRAIEAFNSASSNSLNAVKELMNFQTAQKNIYKDAKIKQNSDPNSTTHSVEEVVRETNMTELLEEAQAELDKDKGGNTE